MMPDNLPSVIDVLVGPAWRLTLTFSDGASGEIDVAAEVPFTGVFAPLAERAYFARVRVDAELGTIAWPNGADLDPLVLHARITGRPLPEGLG